MPRTPVTDRIAAILGAAPTIQSGHPMAYTYRDLATEVYAADEPTAAQLSAVRRAVAALVAEGRGERDPEREPGTGAGTHRRTRPPATEVEKGRLEDLRDAGLPTGRLYANPPGVAIRRPMTDADREARAAVLARSPSLAEHERELEKIIRGRTS
jgi:hypothetical protein